MRYGMVVLAAGFSACLSFSLLAVAIGTDYWYIIDVDKPNCTGSDELSSHSGLWRINEGLHKVVVILLPLSLVLLVFGWIFGLVSSLACSPNLLAGSALYFLFCSLFTLSGVSIYIKHSNLAYAEFQRVVSPENLALVDVSFGWSFATAWLSYSMEVATGLLLMLAARITQIKGDSGVAIAML
ncbi:transmembrane protein 235 isoform X2 [Cottoperca gobio]|uniref:Transmembrane protein 235 isoform X2 n=1 Tax=Cottoperca gobio TaxID=56716 RepID=A0A6J2Q5G3_COTGO|nr:transmembrane protein 235-like isoform X2 [Cottoperca gobio]